MQDKFVEGSGTQPAAPPSPDKPFLTPLRYPEDPAVPRPARAAGTPRGRLFSRVILPLILFVVVVAGTAWVTQNLPNWRKPRIIPPVVPPGTSLLRFDETKAIWNKDDPDFAAEFEFGKEGFYDFPFTNLTAVPIQLGVAFMSCGCSKASVWLGSTAELEAFKKDKNGERLPWQVLAKGDATGITVPPGSGGVVRLGWTVRKSNSRSNLSMSLWTQAAGRPREEDIHLQALVAFVLPVRYSPHIKNFGTLNPNAVERAEFWFWSATRDHFDLDVRDKKDNPNFVFEAKPLSAAECLELTKHLKVNRDISTRVKSAYKVTAEVHEERGGHHLDQGPFMRTVPMTVDHMESDEHVGPTLKGRVRGDIVVGTPEDDGHLDLKSFPVNSKRERRFTLSTAAGVKLVPDQVPDFLEVEVTPKTKANDNTQWELRAAVKPGVLRPGPLPEDSAVILRTDGMPPRRVRIPVLGNAVPR